VNKLPPKYQVTNTKTKWRIGGRDATDMVC